MKMEDENITGDELIEMIRERRRFFHSKARFPNGILINSSFFNLIKQDIGLEHNSKKIFDLEIFITDDIPSFKLIRLYNQDECSIY